MFDPTQVAIVRPCECHELDAGAPWTVQWVSDPVAFEALRPAWNELLASSGADCMFLTWEWLHTWWRHLGGEERRLALVTVWRGRELEALAPWAVGPSRAWRPLPARSVHLLGTGTVGSDYLDVIVRRGREHQALAALAGWLAEQGGVVELDQLHGGRSAARDLARRLSAWGWSAVERPVNVCPYVDLAGASWEGYLARLGSSHRQNVRRRLRKLDEQFEVDFRRVDSEDEVEPALETLVELHRRRWRGRGGSDALDDPRVVAFHRELARLAFRRGWLRLYVLSLDGRPAAALYGFRYRDRFLFYQSGFDPELRRHSVGLVTMALSIRDAIEEGAREYDLLHGDESYKHLWASGTREISRLELYPPSPGAAVQRGLRGAKLAAKGRVRSWAERAPAALRGPLGSLGLEVEA